MASSLDIRLAAASDADHVVALIGRLLTEISSAVGSPQFEFDTMAAKGTASHLLYQRQMAALLAWAGTLPVGIITLSPCHALYAGGSFGIITELFVDPPYRAHGIGAHLVAAARRYGVEQGWARLEVTTPPLPVFERTLHFYQRLGFAITGGHKLKLPL